MHENHPLRIRRLRAAGKRNPHGAVYVGRNSRWGNPFCSAEAFERWLADGTFNPAELIDWKTPEQLPAYRERMLDARTGISLLRGRRLMCFCSLDQPCHGDVLARLANDLHAMEGWLK